MHFQLTEEHLMIQKAARDFAQNELKPGVIERDEKQIFPAEQIKKLGELGFLGMMVDPKYGGSGLDAISYVIAMEELSKVDAKKALDAFIDATTGALKKGDRVALVGFGSFSISARAARKGRNPQTGKEIKIAAKKVVKFKAGTELSGKVK